MPVRSARRSRLAAGGLKMLALIGHCMFVKLFLGQSQVEHFFGMCTYGPRPRGLFGVLSRLH